MASFEAGGDAVEVAQEEEVAGDVDVADDVAVELEGDFKLPYPLNPAAALHVAARIVAQDKLWREIARLNVLYCGYITVAEHYLAVAQGAVGVLLELLDAHGEISVQGGNVALHALHSLRVEFGRRWRDGTEHVLHIGVVEHGAMHDADARFLISTPQSSISNPQSPNMVESVATHLLALNHDVVAAVVAGVKPQALEHLHNGVGVVGKSSGHIVAAGDVAEHEVVHVGIDASSTALAAVVLNAVLLAVGNVNLAVDELVAAKNHSGSHAPSEEQFVNTLVVFE